MTRLFLKKIPSYVTKTDKNGFFHFPNLKGNNYNIIALTGFDFIYNKEEKIAFLDSILNPKTDSFVSLFAFNPIVADSIAINSKGFKKDSINSSLNLDSIIKRKLIGGKLKVKTNTSAPCIFQLLQEEKY